MERVLVPTGDLTPPVLKQPSVKKKRSTLPTAATPATTCPLKMLSTLAAAGTQLQRGTPSSPQDGEFPSPIALQSKVAQRGNEGGREENTEEGDKGAISRRGHSAVLPLAQNLALNQAACNAYAVEPEAARKAPPVHSEGVTTPNTHTLRALLRTKEFLRNSTTAREVGGRVTPSQLNPSYDRPRLGEHGEERVGMFARLLPPCLSTGSPQSKATVGKSIQSDKMPKVAQGTATAGHEAALQKPQSRPCITQSAPAASHTSNSCMPLHPVTAKDVGATPKPLKWSQNRVEKIVLAPDSETDAFLLGMDAVLEPDHAPQAPASPQQPAESSNLEGLAHHGQESGETPEPLEPKPKSRQGQEIILALKEPPPNCLAEECCDTEHLDTLDCNLHTIRDRVLMKYESL